jgi:hypothetical protein
MTKEIKDRTRKKQIVNPNVAFLEDEKGRQKRTIADLLISEYFRLLFIFFVYLFVCFLLVVLGFELHLLLEPHLHLRLLLFLFFLYSFIQMCIQCLGHSQVASPC